MFPKLKANSAPSRISHIHLLNNSAGEYNVFHYPFESPPLKGENAVNYAREPLNYRKQLLKILQTPHKPFFAFYGLPIFDVFRYQPIILFPALQPSMLAFTL